MVLSPGSYFSHFEVSSLIGSGGMGEVYLAHDIRLHRPVSLKLLSTLIGDSAYLSLEREARTTTALNHPNIVTVYEIGSVEKQAYMACEYVKGVTIRDYLINNAPSLRKIMDFAIQMTAALSAAESAGVIHQDIKPENMMIREDGIIKILDFGLAIAQHQDNKNTKIGGTIPYMSPEKIQGLQEMPNPDIWSAAVVIYELLKGERPFQGEGTVAMAKKIISFDPFPMNCNVPKQLECILQHALEKSPDKRYSSMKSFNEDLKDLDLQLKIQEHAHTVSLQPNTPILEKEIHNLPKESASFIGRDPEIASLIHLLMDPRVRLITLSGPGGSGKTKLALHTAWQLVENFEIFYVPLSSINDHHLVPEEILDVLDQDCTTQTIEKLIFQYLRKKQALLVIDNFEQVIDASPFIHRLLMKCPQVKMIITSREILRISGEQEFPVAPLELPNPQDLDHLDRLTQCSAIKLFEERARACRPNFTINQSNAQDIAEICTLLDGLPLAIELAAARIRFLEPAEIRKRMDTPMKLLTGGNRERPLRQQTIAGAINWSYELLSDLEKTTFNRLSVFADSFNLSAANALFPSGDIVEELGSLTEKSMLKSIQSSNGIRFQLLHTLRVFGQEQLNTSGEEEITWQWMTSYYAEHLEQHKEALTKGNRNALDIYMQELNNVRTVLKNCLKYHFITEAHTIYQCIANYWRIRGHYEEGINWGKALISHGKHSAALGGTLSTIGKLSFLNCNYPEAKHYLQEALVIARETCSPTLVETLKSCSSVAREMAEYDLAHKYLSEAEELTLKDQDEWMLANLNIQESFIFLLEGKLDLALKCVENAQSQALNHGDRPYLAWMNLITGMIFYHKQQLSEAEIFTKKCLLTSKSVGFKEGKAWALETLGLIALKRDEMAQARECLQESLHIHWEIGDRWRSCSLLENIAELARNAKKPHISLALYQFARKMRQNLKTPMPPIEKPFYEANWHQLQEDLHPSPERELEEQTADQIIALALSFHK